MTLWPNFFIVGAPRTGTTSLYEYLKIIPEIYMSPFKEPSYFAKNLYPKDSYSRRIGNKDEYLALFKKVKHEKIIGEASTSYLADPDAAKLIKETSPNSKCLISIRDPIERAFSHYRFHCQYNRINISFHEQIKMEINEKIEIKDPRIRLMDGLYHDHIQRFWKTFKKNNVMIIIFEDFINNPKITVDKVLKFLNVDYSLDKNFQFEHHNKSQTKKMKPRENTTKFDVKINNPQLKKSRFGLFGDFFLSKNRNNVSQAIENKDRKLLFGYYKDDVKKLENILERKFPWKNFQN